MAQEKKRSGSDRIGSDSLGLRRVGAGTAHPENGCRLQAGPDSHGMRSVRTAEAELVVQAGQCQSQSFTLNQACISGLVTS